MLQIYLKYYFSRFSVFNQCFYKKNTILTQRLILKSSKEKTSIAMCEYKKVFIIILFLIAFCFSFNSHKINKAEIYNARAIHLSLSPYTRH